jgi:predicted phosphodiesterase
MSRGLGGGTESPDTVLLLGVGDTHGDFAPLFQAARREPAARAILQVGDLTAGKAGREQHVDDDPAVLADLPIPLVWVHGNHEHWSVLGLDEHGRRDHDARTPGYHLWPGDLYVVPGTRIRVAGLPGNFAPTWYFQDKPFPGDRVRHFNAQDVAALERLGAPTILLMHESFRGQLQGRVGSMGIPALREVVRRLRPQVCLTGHHHAYGFAEHGPTLAIALPRAQEGYVRLRFTTTAERSDWDIVPFAAS